MYQTQIYSHVEKKFIDCNPDNGWVGKHINIEQAKIEREQITRYYFNPNNLIPPIVRIIIK